MSTTPGNELFQMFAPAAADQPGSDNLPGIRNPALEPIIEKVLQAKTREQLEVAARALDRVLRHGWYMVPHFHLATHRVAFSDELAYPERLPTYYAAQPWMSRTWWRKP
jgi:microcin C transport system substrate-binding protein